MEAIKTSRCLFESILLKIDKQSDLEYTLSSLYSLFQDELIDSLKLIDNQNITIIYCDQRQVFEIKNLDKVYYCFKHVYYCTCLSYKHNVISSNEITLCKHLIASRIAERVKLCKYKEVESDYIIKILKGFEL